mgnify:FL=1
MNIYQLSRIWFDFAFENPHKIKPQHAAIYFFAIEHCNRLGWKKVFGFPTSMVLEAIGMKSYGSYKKYLEELVEYGFIIMHEYSKNQYSSNIIELNFNVKALDKALDKAFIKHTTKQSESTQQSNDSIDKQINNVPINQTTSKPKNFSPPTLEEVDNYFLEKGLQFEEAKKEAQKFIDYYTSNGWRVGKNKMKNWKGAASGWFNRLSDFKKEKSSAKKEKRNAMDILMEKHKIDGAS